MNWIFSFRSGKIGALYVCGSLAILALSGCAGSGDFVLGCSNFTTQPIEGTAQIRYLSRGAVILNQSFEFNAPPDSWSHCVSLKLPYGGEASVQVQLTNGTIVQYDLRSPWQGDWPVVEFWDHAIRFDVIYT